MRPLLLVLFFLVAPFVPSLAQGSENALKFNGSNNYILSSKDNRGITSEVTVTAWVKTSSKKLQMVATKYDRDAEHGYQLLMRDGKAAFAGRDGSGEYRHSGYSFTTIDDDKWHHLAGVLSNGIWIIYIDGTMQMNFNSFYKTPDLRSNAPLTIGNYYLVNADYFDGIIDEVRIWNRALTDYEIIENMCQKIPASSPGLVGYFKFDEGSGVTVNDHSLLNLSGNLTNMSAASARVVSGAPIGDKSVYLAAWRNDGEKLKFKGAGDVVFSIDSIEAYGKIVHLYYVNIKPNYTNGLSKPEQVNEYFGVFTSRSPDLKHTVSFKLGQESCSATLFTRDNNSTQQWQELNTTYQNNSFSASSTGGRGEYTIISTDTKFPLNLPSDIFACAGEQVIIDVTLDGATYLWSTGATTSQAKVISPATISLELTVDGCTYTRVFNVTNEECITIPNIITPNGDQKNDSFVIQGASPASTEIEIFNRWGVSVYKKEGYDGTWSAQSLPAGTYYYVVKSTKSNRAYKGWVEVIF